MRYTRLWSERKRIRRKDSMSGVFREVNDDECDDSDEEEDDDIQFLSFQEMNSMSNGKTFVQGKRPKELKGVLVDQRRGALQGRQQIIQGSFHLTDPWWIIHVLRTKGPRNYLKKQNDRYSVAYEIRKDEFVVANKCIFQYLRGPEVQSKYETAAVKFVDFVRLSLGREQDLTFEHLPELLSLFENHLPEDQKGDAMFLQFRMKSPCCQLPFKALKFPDLFFYLPQLLPLQFLKIVELPEERLEILDKDLKERPWVFGFRKILASDHHVLGCEAQYNAFELSGLEDWLEQLHKDSLIMYDYLKNYSRDGHTCAKLDFVKSEMKNYVKEFDKAVAFLSRKKIVKVLTIERTNWIFLHHLYDAERMIAKYVDKMFRYQLQNKWTLDVDFDSDNFKNIRSDLDQLKAAKALTQLPVVVISGKGGCGKTTVVTKVMSSCDLTLPSHLDPTKEEENDSILDEEWSEGRNDTRRKTKRNKDGIQDSEMDSQLCVDDDKEDEKDKENLDENDWTSFPVIIYTAPTGKAANLLGRRATTKAEAELGTRTPGYTLHQIIWSYRRYINNDKKDEKMWDQKNDDRWKFKNVHTVVVDECSLVAVTTFETMISALITEAKLRRIILLGDVRQLPSIEPGNFLADMFRVLDRYGCSFELKTNHRSESQLIIDNATRISLRQYPFFDPERKFKLHRIPHDKDNNFINEVLINLLRKEEELKSDETSQFVTFRNQTIDIINEIACKYYNNHTLVNERKKKIFRTKDKICLKKNSLVVLYEKEGNEIRPVMRGSRPSVETEVADPAETSMADHTITPTQKDMDVDNAEKIRLCNGEIFFIDEDYSIMDQRGKEARYLMLNNRDPDDPRSFWVNFREVKRNCKMTHSWARTIHTFQGSETETVVYVLGSSVSWQNWQHVYTAVTRGKKSVHIVGPDSVLQEAIAKMEPRRYTMLDYQLTEQLPKPEEIAEMLRVISPQKSVRTNTSSVDSGTSRSFTQIKRPCVHSPSVVLNGSHMDNVSHSPQPGPSGLQNLPSRSISDHQSIIKAGSMVNLDQKAKGSSTNPQQSLSNESQWSEVDDLDLTSALESEEARNEAILAFTRLNNLNGTCNVHVNEERSSEACDDLPENSERNSSSPEIIDYDSDETEDPCKVVGQVIRVRNSHIKTSASLAPGGIAVRRTLLEEVKGQRELTLSPKDETIHEEEEEMSQSLLLDVPHNRSGDMFEDASFSDTCLTQLADLVEADEDLADKSVNFRFSQNANISTYRSPTLTTKSGDSDRSSDNEQELSGYISMDSDLGSSPNSPLKRIASSSIKAVTPKKQKLILEKTISPARKSFSRLSMSQND